MLSFSAPEKWIERIDARADPLRMTRAAFARCIVEKWFEAGEPPVTEPDRLMQIARMPAKRAV